jgi:hypothetical protein
MKTEISARLDKMRAKQKANLSPQADAPPTIKPSSATVVSEQPKPKKKRRSHLTPAHRDSIHQQKGRLPDGSRVEALYDAASQKWTGKLSVPALGTVQTFEGKGDGLFGLLSWLDDQYRAADSLANNAANAASQQLAEHAETVQNAPRVASTHTTQQKRC